MLLLGLNNIGNCNFVTATKSILQCSRQTALTRALTIWAKSITLRQLRAAHDSLGSIWARSITLRPSRVADDSLGSKLSLPTTVVKSHTPFDQRLT